MKEVGIFEAKTKLSEICEGVASTGEPVTVTKRGKPIVVVYPVPGKSAGSVWERRERYMAEHPEAFGPDEPDFTLPDRSQEVARDPFDDEASA